MATEEGRYAPFTRQDADMLLQSHAMPLVTYYAAMPAFVAAAFVADIAELVITLRLPLRDILALCHYAAS